MPCLIKQRTEKSPGVIVFTHNELLNGVIDKSTRVQEFLSREFSAKRWIFGIHIQGDCSHLNEWPLTDWQSFLMWPDPSVGFLRNVPEARKTSLTCLNFLPQPRGGDEKKDWDICIVSRASTIKRIKETLLIVQDLFKLKDDLKVLFVVPDMRNLDFGDSAYKRQDIDRSYFELPRKIFSCKHLKQISFISSSQRAFGTFPISDELISEFIGRSKFLLLTSYREGGPRVVAEAFTLGTPCVLSKKFVGGLSQYLDEHNTVFIDDDIGLAAKQILGALSSYQKFETNPIRMQNQFCESANIEKLKSMLVQKIESNGSLIEGAWYFADLNLRLACHGRKHNMQFMNDDRLFFDWMAKVEACVDREPDEDYLFGSEPLQDRAQWTWAEARRFWHSRVLYPAVRKVKSIFLG